MSCPLFVELCAGTAALSLRLHAGRNARPPVSRMGAKTGYADVILRVLGLRPGQGHADGTRYLWCEPDAGVRLLLHAYTDRELAQAAADIIRSWKDEDPRALWERLRAEGPARCPEGLTAREVARWVFTHARTHRIGDGFAPERDPRPGRTGFQGQGPARVQLAARLFGGVPATIHPDARAIDPREVARWARIVSANELLSLDSRTWENTGAGGSTFAGNTDHGFYRPIARLAAGFDAVPVVPGLVVDDAREIDPPTLPPGTVAYMDPPYVDTTGYAHDLGRDEVVKLARRWADAGATVCISEAEPIPELLADGWHKVEITGERKGQRRTFSKQQREWVTLSRPPAWTPSVQASLFGAA